MSQHWTRAWDWLIARTHSCNGWPVPAGCWKWCGERCKILHYPVYESYNASLCHRTEDHCPWQTESSCLWKRRNSILSTGTVQSKLKQHTRGLAWTGVSFLLFLLHLGKQKKLWASHGHSITILILFTLVLTGSHMSSFQTLWKHSIHFQMKYKSAKVSFYHFYSYDSKC